MREKLRIMHITGWYPLDENDYSGIFIKNHILSTLSCSKPFVFYGIEDRNLSKIYEVVRREDREGISLVYFRYKKFPLRGLSYLLYTVILISFFLQLRKKGLEPDLIHAHEYWCGVPAVIIGKIFGKPVVVTEHFTGFPLGKVKGIERLKAYIAFRFSNVVTAVSNFLVKSIIDQGYRGNFRVIPNVVDTSKFYPVYQDEEKGEKKRQFLVIASLISRKRIDLILESAKILKEKGFDFKIGIVGDGPMKEHFENEIKMNGLEDFVLLKGKVPHEEIAELMRHSTGLISASDIETFGVTIIEAMAAGIPVIATKSGGPEEIITDDTGILIPVNDALSLSLAMEKILKGEKKFSREKLIETASSYSSQKIGEKICKLYYELISRG